MNLEEIGLVEMSSQEVQEVDGGLLPGLDQAYYAGTVVRYYFIGIGWGWSIIP
jgi:hypothetical protein